jgi:hypothetical protein
MLIEVPALAPPTRSVRSLAEEDRVKLGCKMIIVIVVWLLTVPEVPVNVTEYVPAAAVVLRVKVNPIVLVLTDANAAVTPAGTPDAARLTLPLKPLRSATTISIGLL